MLPGESVPNLQAGGTTQEIASSPSLSLFRLPDHLVPLSSLRHGGSSNPKRAGSSSGSLSESPVPAVIKNRGVQTKDLQP